VNYVAAFFTAIVSVFFRVLQQRNVQGDHYMLVLPTSLGIAACEMVLLGMYFRDGVGLGYVISTGSGAGFGCIAAMYVHRRFVKPRA